MLILLLSCLLSVFLFYGLLMVMHQLGRLKRQIKLLTSNLHEKVAEIEKFTSELSELKTQFYDNVSHDVLTGLPSRQVFEDRLIQTVNQSQRYQLLCGLVFLDIDGFKVINDALGYHVGDELLKEVATRLKSTLRQVDTACRFSGDEFVILFPQIAKVETCAYISQRLLDVISQPFIINQQELYITASIGIAIYPNDCEDAMALMKSADNALNQAKQRGCNVYQFYREEMQMLSQRELMLNSSLRHASVYHEFTIFYQPQVDITSKEIICMEALLRWQHPTFGLVTPTEFLRLAENSGKIIEIGEWVMRTVCQQFQKWKVSGFHLKKVSINVSLRQLENPHYIYKLSQTLREMNMTPESVILEISEGQFQNVDLLEKSLKMLKQIGVQIAIDDFGTGRLSLQELKKFSIDYLKIDGSFIQNMTVNPESEAITKMIIALANTLHQGIIAEGVETREQKEMLITLGCNVMQGHFFSIPRLAEEFTPEIEKAIGEL